MSPTEIQRAGWWRPNINYAIDVGARRAAADGILFTECGNGVFLSPEPILLSICWEVARQKLHSRSTTPYCKTP
jgi:hypothetical protein